MDATENTSLKFDFVDPEELPQIKKLETNQIYLLRISEDSVVQKFVDGLNVTCFVGANSIDVHIKRKPRNCLYCLLENVDIDKIIESGKAKRKANYRERREEKRNGKKVGENKTETDGTEEK